MRKFFWFMFIPVFFLTGCSHPAAPVSGQADIIRETVSETQPAAASVRERAELLTDSANQHIYDEENLLTEQEIQLYTNYLDWIASSRLVNAFVVLTSNLDDNTPEQFAEIYYQSVYDASNPDGFLILINNDTNQDYIYTAGRCQQYLTQPAIDVSLSGATRDLIEGNYADALDRILLLGEKMPAYVIDRTGMLTEAEIQEFSQKIEIEAEVSCAVILLSLPEGEEPDGEAYQQKCHADILLFVDPEKKSCRIAGNVPEQLESEILQIWEEQSLPWAIRSFIEKIEKR